MRLRNTSIENIENRRVIVQNRFIKQANIHEILVDLYRAQKDPATGRLEQPGNLRKVAKSLNYFQKKGIDTLYVSGVHKRAHGDPYSVQSRVKIEESIGGEKDFKELLLANLRQRDMKIIVDLFDRVGSTHMSGKHRKLLMHHIDATNNYTHFHGAEGKSIFSFSSTSILNYRKKAAWDELIKDAIKFVKEYEVDGLHLDNCHLWPTLKRINKAEMYRKDAEGHSCYTPTEILDGEVINGDSIHTIWTDCTECPNPFLVKLMKELWKNFPQLMVIGECWQENSETAVEISGVIPRSHALVRNITEDILSPAKDTDNSFERFKFNDEFMKDYCNGAILLQSTFLYSSNSPIKSFHKSYLAIIDTIFFHEVVPITMHEEIEGIDSETELYIQYFNHNFREMHGAIHHPRKKSFSELLDDEELETEENEEELMRKEFSEKVMRRFEMARNLTKEKHCLQFGRNVPLKCVNVQGKINGMLAYCRYTQDQIGIIITNFNDEDMDVWVDFSPLKENMRELIKHETTILKISYWTEERAPEHHLINEFLNCPHKFRVRSHDSLLFEVDIEGTIDTNPHYYGEARNNFIETLNLIHTANHMETANIYSNYIKHLVECYEAHKDPNYITNFGDDTANLMDFHKFISHDPAVYNIIEEIVDKNKMGPIVFVTPELAPWFKIGGLAVMVDELARGFANLGEDTYVIVPYYEHKKGTGEKIELDPEGKYGIRHIKNIEVTLGACHEVFGIHHGKVGGVNVYFIHHSVYFYEPYQGSDNYARLRTCTLFCKAALQLLCDIQTIPEVVVTNDWFAAFTAGYARDQSHFGPIFENTSFLHIFHNLDISYEGRFYTNIGETMGHIHCLPNEWLIDPYWVDHIVNPSRLALVASDQWASVSKSYRDQIKIGSPLAALLNKFPEPFACSNGVHVKERLKALAAELKKRKVKHMDHLDAKRFLQK